jgi:hypothetical protein
MHWLNSVFAALAADALQSRAKSASSRRCPAINSRSQKKKRLVARRRNLVTG